MAKKNIPDFYTWAKQQGIDPEEYENEPDVEDYWRQQYDVTFNRNLKGKNYHVSVKYTDGTTKDIDMGYFYEDAEDYVDELSKDPNVESIRFVLNKTGKLQNVYNKETGWKRPLHSFILYDDDIEESLNETLSGLKSKKKLDILKELKKDPNYKEDPRWKEFEDELINFYRVDPSEADIDTAIYYTETDWIDSLHQMESLEESVSNARDLLITNARRYRNKGLSLEDTINRLEQYVQKNVKNPGTWGCSANDFINAWEQFKQKIRQSDPSKYYVVMLNQYNTDRYRDTPITAEDVSQPWSFYHIIDTCDSFEDAKQSIKELSDIDSDYEEEDDTDYDYMIINNGKIVLETSHGMLVDESLTEDTVKQNGKWVNKGKEGTHGKFRTKKAADDQRKAMFRNGYKGESLDKGKFKVTSISSLNQALEEDYRDFAGKEFKYKVTIDEDSVWDVINNNDNYTFVEIPGAIYIVDKINHNKIGLYGANGILYTNDKSLFNIEESLNESGDNLLFNVGTRFKIKGSNNIFKITWKDEFGNVTYKGISPRTRGYGGRLDSLEKDYEDGEIELLTPEQYESLDEAKGKKYKVTGTLRNIWHDDDGNEVDREEWEETHTYTIDSDDLPPKDLAKVKFEDGVTRYWNKRVRHDDGSEFEVEVTSVEPLDESLTEAEEPKDIYTVFVSQKSRFSSRPTERKFKMYATSTKDAWHAMKDGSSHGLPWIVQYGDKITYVKKGEEPDAEWFIEEGRCPEEELQSYLDSRFKPRGSKEEKIPPMPDKSNELELLDWINKKRGTLGPEDKEEIDYLNKLEDNAKQMLELRAKARLDGRKNESLNEAKEDDYKEIKFLKDELGYLAYSAARNPLSDKEKELKKKYEDRLRSLGKKYDLDVHWYVRESLDEAKNQEYEYTLYNTFSKNSFHKKVKCSSKEEAEKIANDELKKLQKNGHFKDFVVKGVKEIQESLDEAKNDTLNPAIWENDELKPEVKEKLQFIADKFIEKLEADDIPLDVDDIVIVGSNRNYNYGPQSDIDLHIIADLSQFKGREKELAEKIYQRKKSIFNDRYDPTINGFEVEIYVEPAEDKNDNDIPDEVEEPLEEQFKKPSKDVIEQMYDMITSFEGEISGVELGEFARKFNLENVEAAEKVIDCIKGGSDTLDNGDPWWSLIKEEIMEDKDLEEGLVQLSEEDIKHFESQLDELGFDIEGKGRTTFGNLHYQVILRGDHLTEQDLRRAAKRLNMLSDKMDDLGIPMTYNVGMTYDDEITAGLDLHKKYIKEEESLEEDVPDYAYGYNDAFDNAHEMDYYGYEDEHFEEIPCPCHEDEFLVWTGTQGKSDEFKCPVCGKYYYRKEGSDKLTTDYEESLTESAHDEIDQIYDYLNNEGLGYFDVSDGGSGLVVVSIECGDWKHEHARCDRLMMQIGYGLEDEEVTDEDGSDTYSSNHIYKCYVPGLLKHYVGESLNEDLDSDIDDFYSEFDPSGDEMSGFVAYDWNELNRWTDWLDSRGISYDVNEITDPDDGLYGEAVAYLNLNESLTEGANGSVEDYLKQMKKTGNPEKVMKNAKGNPNAEKAYKQFKEIKDESLKEGFDEADFESYKEYILDEFDDNGDVDPDRWYETVMEDFEDSELAEAVYQFCVQLNNGEYYDADHAAEWMERNPHGYYNNESDYGTGEQDESLNESGRIHVNDYDTMKRLSKGTKWNVPATEKEFDNVLNNLDVHIKRSGKSGPEISYTDKVYGDRVTLDKNRKQVEYKPKYGYSTPIDKDGNYKKTKGTNFGKYSHRNESLNESEDIEEDKPYVVYDDDLENDYSFETAEEAIECAKKLLADGKTEHASVYYKWSNSSDPYSDTFSQLMWDESDLDEPTYDELMAYAHSDDQD